MDQHSFSILETKVHLPALAFIIILCLVVLAPPLFGSIAASKAIMTVFGGGLLLIVAAFEKKYFQGITINRKVAMGLLGAGILVVLSSALSLSPIASFFGAAILDQGSGIFLLSLIAAVYVGMSVMRHEDSLALLLKSLVLLAGAASLFTLFDFLFFHLWIEEGKTVLGNVRTLEMIAWMGLLSFAFLRPQRLFQGRVLMLLFATFSLVFITLFGIMGIAGYAASLLILVIYVVSFVVQKENASAKKIALATLVICFMIATGVRALSPISSALPSEFRPSFNLTMRIATETLTSDIRTFLFGTGPAQFSVAWEETRTVTLNKSQFWSEKFDTGATTLMTRSIEVGTLLTFFAALFLVIMLLVSIDRKKIIYERLALTFILGYGSLWFVLSTPHPGIELLFAVLVGTLAARTFPEKKMEANERDSFHKIKIFLLGIGGISLFFTGALYFFSYVHYSMGIKSYAGEGVEKGIIYLKRASVLVPSSFFAESLGRAYQGVVDKAIRSTEVSRADIAGSLVDASESVQKAAFLNPGSFSVFMLMGDIFTARALLGDVSMVAYAKEAYDKAQSLSPQHPLPFLHSGQLAVYLDDREAARTFILGALERKPGYEAAQKLLQTVETKE